MVSFGMVKGEPSLNSLPPIIGQICVFNFQLSTGSQRAATASLATAPNKAIGYDTNSAPFSANSANSQPDRPWSKGN